MNITFDSLISNTLRYWNMAESWILSHQELASFGVIVALAAILTLFLFAFKMLWGAARSAHIAGTASQVRRGTDIGARVLITQGFGKNGKAASEFLSEAARSHLKGFMFGGPFDVIDFPARIANEEEAQSLLKQAGADLVMWGEGTKKNKIVARIARRDDSKKKTQYQHRTLTLPQNKDNWTSPLSAALAYATARELRPALSRPQDFRAERLEPVVLALQNILNEKPGMDAALRGDIEDDYSAGSVQLAIADMGDWRTRSVEILQKTLSDIDRSETPDRWVRAKINLGRALKIRCEQKFDPIILQESVGHLTDALEALRAESKFKTAELAAQTISDCQKMLGTRRRFSITRGGI
ncbi:hypothetical protein [Hirschia litorea]|uniref:Uncharacterized protein n=1 Tax=Hirschia litorea TaxID=1199156 RepID=A0ABW2IL74_9PROT